MTIDEDLQYVADSSVHEWDGNYDVAKRLAAEVRRLREENSALLNRVGAYDFEVTRLQKALDEERSLTAATAEHTTALDARLKWFEDREPHVREDILYCQDYVGSAAHNWEAEHPNPKPGATT